MLRETYDDNVFILDTKPNAGIVPPENSIIARPRKESFVTTVSPWLRLGYRLDDKFSVTAGYAPDIVRYHSASTENYIAHRGSLHLAGRIKEASYDWQNSVLLVDGSHLTPTVLRPGDCRAVGGIPLRERRDQVMFRNGLKVIIPIGDWFLRPVLNSYVHDFQTEHRANTNTTEYLYENYIDRHEISGGFDLGYAIAQGLCVVGGYRLGHQHQARVPGRASPFPNTFHRLLVGLEGQPLKWIKLSVLAGPDWRVWDRKTPAGFDRNEVVWFWDGSITLTAGAADTFTLKASRYQQPAFTSHSMYEDIRYEIAWRRKFTERLTAGAGFTLYIGDWQAPMNREDWIYTPNAMASYEFNRHLAAEFNYSCDWVENQVPTSAPGATYAPGREYTRHLVSVAVKYTF